MSGSKWTMFAVSTCETCEVQMFIVYRPEDRPLAETMREHSDGAFCDFVVVDNGLIACPQCGEVTILPPPELLDLERSPLMQFLASWGKSRDGLSYGMLRLKLAILGVLEMIEDTGQMTEEEKALKAQLLKD